MVVVCSKRAAFRRRSIPAASLPGRLVLAETLEQLDVAELAGGGLGQTGLEGVEHAEELELGQRLFQVVRLHRAASSMSKSRSGPCRWAGAAGGDWVSWSSSSSIPATKMPFTVL